MILPATDVIDVVCAADEAYAMPLAVTVRSALEKLPANRKMRLWVLDGGISEQSKDRLLGSWNIRQVDVHWLRPDLSLIDDLQISRHVNLVTYYRLLMPWVLPETIDRVIFLDADLLVRRDISELWDLDQGSAACLAVPDTAAPCIDARVALPNFDRSHRFLAAVEPVPNYRELGLPPTAKYFNAGVLVVNLQRWRDEQICNQALECLRQHKQHVRWWDQYALNVVLAGKWKELDARWNQGGHAYSFPSWSESPLTADIFRQLRRDPWIVHFTSQHKPWHYFCRHPMLREYLNAIDRTDWSGWRPKYPSEQGLRKWWEFQVAPLRHAVKVGIVRAKRMTGAQKSAA
jgi:lipopolysaccharide biosynthesis glycosyltransferase